MKIILRSTLLILVFVLLGCGATPGIPETPTPPNPDLASYKYRDNVGNTYAVSSQKLIYTPISEENTVDGLPDQGYFTQLNISKNDYAKFAAAFELQLSRKQGLIPTTRDSLLPPPYLDRTGGKVSESVDLDLTAVKALNYLLQPFLNDE